MEHSRQSESTINSPAWYLFPFVIAGGPAAGKTTSLQILRKLFADYGIRTVDVCEASTLLWQCDVPFPTSSTLEHQQTWEVEKTRLQVFMENTVQEIVRHEACTRPVVVLCDRGVLDAAAYTDSEETWFRIMQENGFQGPDEIIARYRAVIHLASLAVDCPTHYKQEGSRRENVSQAAIMDKKIWDVWSSHAEHHFVPSAVHGAMMWKTRCAFYHILSCIGIVLPIGPERSLPEQDAYQRHTRVFYLPTATVSLDFPSESQHASCEPEYKRPWAAFHFTTLMWSSESGLEAISRFHPRIQPNPALSRVYWREHFQEVESSTSIRNSDRHPTILKWRSNSSNTNAGGGHLVIIPSGEESFKEVFKSSEGGRRARLLFRKQIRWLCRWTGVYYIWETVDVTDFPELSETHAMHDVWDERMTRAVREDCSSTSTRIEALYVLAENERVLQAALDIALQSSASCIKPKEENFSTDLVSLPKIFLQESNKAQTHQVDVMCNYWRT